MKCNCRRYINKKNVQTLLLCYISFQLYKVIILKRSINGLISVITFKRTMTNISFDITYLQDNYLGTYVSMNTFMTDTQMVAVLTYLCTLCFRLRASDWTSNVQRCKCRILPFTRNCLVTFAPWVWLRPKSLYLLDETFVIDKFQRSFSFLTATHTS